MYELNKQISVWNIRYRLYMSIYETLPLTGSFCVFAFQADAVLQSDAG